MSPKPRLSPPFPDSADFLDARDLVVAARGPSAPCARAPEPLGIRGSREGAHGGKGQDFGAPRGKTSRGRGWRRDARGLQHSEQSLRLFGAGQPRSQVGEGEPRGGLPCAAPLAGRPPPAGGAGSAGWHTGTQGSLPTPPAAHPPAARPGMQRSRLSRLTQSWHESVEEEADDRHREGHVGDGCAQGALFLADLHHHPAGRGRPAGVRCCHRRRRRRRLGVFVRRLHGGARSTGDGVLRPVLPPSAQGAGGGRLRGPRSGSAPSSGGQRARGAVRLQGTRTPASPRSRPSAARRRAPTAPAEGRRGRCDTR